MPPVSDSAPFSEADLLHAAGDRSYSRGLEYMDAVRNLQIGAGEITATVYGTDEYEIVLDLNVDGASGECSCPYGQEGFFCKHLVAAGLTVLRQGGDLPQQRAAATAKAQVLDTWLDGLSRADLLALVHEQIREDRSMRHRLELRAAAACSDPGDVRARVDELLDVYAVSRRGYLEYSDAKAYSSHIDQVVDVIDELIGAGQAADAAGVARHALPVVMDALEQADDSDGYIGGSAYELAAAHAQACAAASADPVELAAWLAGFVLGQGSLLADVGVGGYGEALGDAGIAEYRRLITAAWQRNPAGIHEKYLMEDLHRATGEVDALVAMYATNLGPGGYTHLVIAQELDRAGRADDALQWAERGVREATGIVNPQLVDYLVGRYEASGAFGRALAARQAAFGKDRTLSCYRALRDAAGKAGQWAAVREQAMRQLEKDAAAYRGRSHAEFGWGGGPVWISALIDDGDIAAAWNAAAGIASARQWLTLADLVGADRPDDALPVYLRAVEPLRSQTGDSVYAQVADLLVKIRDCHERLGTGTQFTAYLTWLRADQKRKRNLIKLLDQRGLRTPAG
jgi:SWIM zinc finger